MLMLKVCVVRATSIFNQAVMQIIHILRNWISTTHFPVMLQELGRSSISDTDSENSQNVTLNSLPESWIAAL